MYNTNKKCLQIKEIKSLVENNVKNRLQTNSNSTKLMLATW